MDSYLGKLVPFHRNKSSSKICCRLLCDVSVNWFQNLSWPFLCLQLFFVVWSVPSIRREISMKQKHQVLKIFLSSIPLCLTVFYSSDWFCRVLFTVTHTAFIPDFIFIGFIFHWSISASRTIHRGLSCELSFIFLCMPIWVLLSINVMLFRVLLMKKIWFMVLSLRVQDRNCCCIVLALYKLSMTSC